MKWIISSILMMFVSANLFSQEAKKNGGDDAGNGGFAYKQSMKILKLAADDLESKIQSVDISEFHDHPEWRTLLNNVLKFDNLEKSWWKSKSRNGQPLSMDYNVRNPKVIVLKHYYQSFMGKTDGELEESVIDTQKRLVHEASHIWGYKEKESEEFSLRFMISANNGALRMTKDISIDPSFCSCKNGRSDIINDCNDFCLKQENTPNPTLYLDAILGKETLKNPNIKNLHDWCNKQLVGDLTSPSCTLTAWDGMSHIKNIQVNIKEKSNSLTADISALKYDTTYIVKITESKSGRDAESLAFQLRRVKVNSQNDNLNTIEIIPVNQYSCLTYFGIINPGGTMTRTSYKRDYFYYPINETPNPIPTGGNFPIFVCHDEITYGSDDSSFYPRLETVENKITLLYKGDPAFVVENNVKKVNSVISNRLQNEYGQNIQIDLINSLFIKTANRSATTLSGYFVIPFINTLNKQAFCPSYRDYSGSIPLFRIMKDYFSELEGLYIAESEPVIIENQGTYNTYYPNQFIRESDLLNNGFIVEHGQKKRIDEISIHQKTVYFYYPFSNIEDPLVQGGRILFTVKNVDELNNLQLKFNLRSSVITSDKRLGCIPKSN